MGIQPDFVAIDIKRAPRISVRSRLSTNATFHTAYVLGVPSQAKSEETGNTFCFVVMVLVVLKLQNRVTIICVFGPTGPEMGKRSVKSHLGIEGDPESGIGRQVVLAIVTIDQQRSQKTHFQPDKLRYIRRFKNPLQYFPVEILIQRKGG